MAQAAWLLPTPGQAEGEHVVRPRSTKSPLASSSNLLQQRLREARLLEGVEGLARGQVGGLPQALARAGRGAPRPPVSSRSSDDGQGLLVAGLEQLWGRARAPAVGSWKLGEQLAGCARRQASGRSVRSCAPPRSRRSYSPRSGSGRSTAPGSARLRVRRAPSPPRSRRRSPDVEQRSAARLDRRLHRAGGQVQDAHVLDVGPLSASLHAARRRRGGR